MVNCSTSTKVKRLSKLLMWRKYALPISKNKSSKTLKSGRQDASLKFSNTIAPRATSTVRSSMLSQGNLKDMGTLTDCLAIVWLSIIRFLTSVTSATRLSISTCANQVKMLSNLRPWTHLNAQTTSLNQLGSSPSLRVSLIRSRSNPAIRS